MRKTRRTARVGEVIRAEIARLIESELRDDLPGLVTVTGAEVSPDLHFARIHVSALDDAKAEAAVAILQRRRGRIRQQLGSAIRLRVTPELDFRVDKTAAGAMRIEQLLGQVLPATEATVSNEVEVETEEDDDE